MKNKLTALLLAALLAFTPSATGFIVKSNTSSEAQAALLAVLPVSIKENNPGLKSYTELVSSSQVYQSGDIITVAAVLEVRNSAKYPAYATIADVFIDVKLDSTSIDFSTCRTAPAVVYNILSADRSSTYKVSSNTVAVDPNCLEYVPDTNSVIIHCKGVPNKIVTDMYGNRIDGTVVNQGLATVGIMQGYAPFCGKNPNSRGWDHLLYLPALNARTYNNDSTQSPDAVQYSILVTGICGNYTKGDMSARVAAYK